ncbi:MAG: AfsR/SARP family transcriptional regulator [Acidimicrobiales bacterium]
MDLRVLGSIAVATTGGELLVPSTAPQRRVLALLATRGGSVVPTEALCDLLALSPAELRTAVADLQSLLGADVVVAEHPGHALRVDDTDAFRFERLVGEARAAGSHAGVDLRARALALFSGPAFGDLAAEPWARAEASRLEALRAHTLQEQDDALSVLASGTPAEGSPPDDGDDLTTGTLTFLFTDIVDSTATWEAEPDTMQHDLYHHDRIVLAAIAKWNGRPFGSGGDGFSAVFRDPSDAVHAAISAQVALRDHPWTSRQRTMVRMGLHTGEAEARDHNYFGPMVNRGARLMSAAQGDQIVVSGTTADLLEPDPRIELVDLGMHTLKGIPSPMHIHGVSAENHPWVDRPLTVARSTLGNVRRTTDAFVGGSGPLADLAAALRSHRLVTLLGPGGVGKTRLGVEVALAEGGAFAGGVWLANLVPISDDEWVAHAVADAFGIRVPEGADPTDALVTDLADREALLVLDNCEHVVDGATALVRRLLRDCPNLTVVATSRQPLHLPGEWVAPVRPLDAGTDGVALLTARAASAGAPTDERDREKLAGICTRLDGIPLAIELAAARLRTMTIDDIDRWLSDRFRLLRGGEPGSHHETLQGTVQWSYELLDDTQQRFFSSVCVFAGDFDLGSAHHLWAATLAPQGADEFDALELLNDLVDRSIVVADRSGRATRYRLLDTLREFGFAQLGSADRRRLELAHLDHYTQRAAAADQQVRGSDWQRGVEAFNDMWSNLRAAVATALEHREHDAVEELIANLAFVTFMRDLGEPDAWAERARAAAPDDIGPAVSALGGLSLQRSGDLGAAVQSFDHGLELDPAPDQLLMLRYLKAVALFGMDQGQQGYEILREQMDEPAPDDALLPMVRSSHAAYGALTGNLSIAEATAGMARSHHELTVRPNDAVSAVVAFNEALLAYLAGDHDRLEQLLLEVLETSEEHGVHYLTELSLNVLSLLPGRTGLGWALAALERAELHGNRALANNALEGGALILFDLGEVETAARVLGYLPHRGSHVGAPRRQEVVELLRSEPDGPALLARGATIDRPTIVRDFEQAAARVLAEPS